MAIRVSGTKRKRVQIAMRELDGENSCVSNYFEYEPMEYYKMACHLPHVLEKRGFKIYPSSDNSLIRGTEEILYIEECRKRGKRGYTAKSKKLYLKM